jgi:photosystem II stability/assembly factor-like uncharacterized protein
LLVVESPVLVHIDFQDANNGWGVTNNGHVLRTMDGGTTWLDATPQDLTSPGYSINLFVLDGNAAWALAPGADYVTGVLYRTSDGGVNWTSYPAPFGGGLIQFLDANTGRVLADRGAGAGSQAVELYRTSDGGVTWTSVFHNDPTQPGASDSLPLSGIKNGMTFRDANTGWVTGSRPVDGEVYLFVTHDGGISWSAQGIPLPADYGTLQFMPQAPVFFGLDGFLPLTVYWPAGNVAMVFYVTHDGGAAWSGDPKDANKVIMMPGLYTFADALHVWSWNGGTDLYFTADGAQMWGGAGAGLDLSDRLSQLESARGANGEFILWVLTGVDDSGHSQLYRSTDGGFNWAPLIP